MSTGEQIFYPKVSPAFIQDSITYSVFARFDRMPDNSWQRMVSDKPLSWIAEHTEKVIAASLEIKTHSLKDEILRWDSTKHIEISIELRENKSTYLFSSEIALEHLNYFLSTYLQE